MKCDLHVHSIHSGMCTTPLLNRICRESYNDPAQVYSRLKQRGMDLVTLTDHDSIGGVEALRHHPDFFASEEVTCRMPTGTIVHIGVYDVTERQHVEIQRRRGDLGSLLAYLTERRLLFSVNHVFSSLTGRREIEDFSWFEAYFPTFETLSGQMMPYHNRQAAQLARQQGKAGLAGSDSHALPSVGSAYTEVPHARNKTEFLDAVRAGKAILHGGNGGYFKLTRDVLWITAQMFKENPWTVLLSPLSALLPLATFATLVDEMVFARLWSSRVGARRNDLQTGLLGREVRQAVEVLAWP
jgi:predicted metal-dependent phosphoesterase TrpH